MSCMRRAHNVFVQPPDGFATSLACHVRAEGASIYNRVGAALDGSATTLACRVCVQPSTGLPRLWHVACANENIPKSDCIRSALDGSPTPLACHMRRAIHLWHVVRAELFVPMLTRARHGGSRAALDGSPTSLACRMRRAILSRAHSWQGTVASGPRVRVPGHRASCPSQAHSWQGTVASGPRVRLPSPLRNRQYEGCCPRRNTTHGGRIPLHTRSPSGRGLIAAHSYHSCIITGRTEALHRAEHRPWSWALSFTH